jgi:hypothetical protein
MKFRLLHPIRVFCFEHHELREFAASIPERFKRGEGVIIHQGRNLLRQIEYRGVSYVVKSFHRPNLFNRFVYGIFRPSKAKRSYRYACRLLGMGVGTPRPMGYVNLRAGLLFDRSYYITALSPCPYRYEQLFDHPIRHKEAVLRAIARTTAVMHEHGMAHKDYGRANILFEDEEYDIRIDIVDLNRMHLGRISLKAGCKNFERLPATPQMHRILADEYARCRGFNADECFRLMQFYRSLQSGKIDNLY